jgi:4'-phosphopantetheinyl transferase
MIQFLIQHEADVPPGTAWLSPRERDAMKKFKIFKRRSDWRRGRWTAKLALRAFFGPEYPPERFEVIPNGAGAPEVHFDGHRLPMGLSLAHCEDRALCALTGADTPIGCDLERIKPRIPEFIEDYFTPEELTFVKNLPPERRDEASTLIWSAKESVLKLFQVGLRADTRSVGVILPSEECISDWKSVGITTPLAADPVTVWKRIDRGMVMTAAVPHQWKNKPVPLKIG